MYRSPAHIPSSHISSAALSLPRVDIQEDDADVDISCAIAERRRQVDDEIARFKASKEKEFQQFEQDLLRRKQKRKRDTGKTKDASPPANKDKAPSALSLLGVLNQSSIHMNGSVARHQKSSESKAAKSKASAPPSKPTLSLDKLNIKGETTPPLTAEGSPPSPSKALKRQFSRSPPHQSLSLTPPRARFVKQEQAQLTPPTSGSDRTSDNFAGIFSPAYLPLLDSRNNGAVPKPTRSESFSIDSSGSVSISPVSRKDRALTAPLIPSNSLPSALRTASGTTMRKRKHVTFQLADRAIVEPSSSYEEGPSPFREDDMNFDEMIDDVVLNGDGDAEDAGHAEDAEDEIESGLGQRTIRSPMIQPKERTSSLDDDQLSPKSTLEVSVEGNMAIGFFELDEELASPGIQSHDAKFIDDDMEDVERSEELRRADGEDDDIDNRPKMTYEYSGSVPINIVRPSGSWVGSFGH